MNFYPVSLNGTKVSFTQLRMKQGLQGQASAQKQGELEDNFIVSFLLFTSILFKSPCHESHPLHTFQINL